MNSIKQQKQRLPYFSDSTALFAPLADSPWAIFLDSGFLPKGGQGQFDIIVAAPETTLLTWGNKTHINHQGHTSVSTDDPFKLIKKYLLPGCSPTVNNIPFNGGAIGYFSYDLARQLERLPVIAQNIENIADMAVGIYSWAVIVDHINQQSWLVGQGNPPDLWQDLVAQFSQLPEEDTIRAFSVLSKPTSNMDSQAYQIAFEKIKCYLKEGDSYQVNLAQRFASPYQGSPWVAYRTLRELNPAPFSAFMNLPEMQILSSSPERFLKVTERIVETKPIKGTRPRCQEAEQDQKQKKYLLQSTKDRAENLMIVDLLRNDISKCCRQGSVKVPKLFDIESFATVHHLVSTVQGVLADNQHALDLLKNCFPGGSITGAPKIRSMEIIEELEPNRRGVYCGSIGYIGFDGNMDSNIAIRTLVCSNQVIRFWAGGGIVNDSVLEEEYQESFDKAAALLALLDQFYQPK